MLKTTLTAATLALLLAAPAFADDDRRGRGDDRDDRYDRRHDDRDDDRSDRRRDHRDDRRHDRRHDRRDDRRGDRYWHDDVRRYYRGNDRRFDHRWDRNHYRRHLPPARYGLSFGYRSGYELAWDDWHRYGRHNGKWRRSAFRGDYGFRAGYEAGWRDATRYYGYGYRPRYWARDPRGSWYFGFEITG